MWAAQGRWPGSTAPRSRGDAPASCWMRGVHIGVLIDDLVTSWTTKPSTRMMTSRGIPPAPAPRQRRRYHRAGRGGGLRVEKRFERAQANAPAAWRAIELLQWARAAAVGCAGRPAPKRGYPPAGRGFAWNDALRRPGLRQRRPARAVVRHTACARCRSAGAVEIECAARAYPASCRCGGWSAWRRRHPYGFDRSVRSLSAESVESSPKARDPGAGRAHTGRNARRHRGADGASNVCAGKRQGMNGEAFVEKAAPNPSKDDCLRRCGPLAMPARFNAGMVYARNRTQTFTAIGVALDSAAGTCGIPWLLPYIEGAVPATSRCAGIPRHRLLDRAAGAFTLLEAQSAGLGSDAVRELGLENAEAVHIRARRKRDRDPCTASASTSWWPAGWPPPRCSVNTRLRGRAHDQCAGEPLAKNAHRAPTGRL